MPDVQQNQEINDPLNNIQDNLDGQQITFREILQQFETRSFGPLLILVAVLALSPIGMIPGMSILTGSVIILLAAQILFFRSSPWLPAFFLNYSISSQKVDKSIQKIRPWVRWTNTLVTSRWPFFTYPPFLQIVAVICILLALTFYPLALVPFGVAAPASAILLFSIGLTARDGVLILLGLSATVGTAALMFWIWPF